MSLYHLALVVAFVVLLVVAVFLFAPIAHLRKPANPASSPEGEDVIFRDDDRYWYGFLYYNPDDPAVMVPKRYGFGYTINLGHPFGKVFIAIIVILMLLPIALAIFVPGLPAMGCHPTSCP